VLVEDMSKIKCFFFQVRIPRFTFCISSWHIYSLCFPRTYLSIFLISRKLALKMHLQWMYTTLSEQRHAARHKARKLKSYAPVLTSVLDSADWSALLSGCFIFEDKGVLKAWRVTW
jgi:hypothetical protein